MTFYYIFRQRNIFYCVLTNVLFFSKLFVFCLVLFLALDTTYTALPGISELESL